MNLRKLNDFPSSGVLDEIYTYEKAASTTWRLIYKKRKGGDTTRILSPDTFRLINPGMRRRGGASARLVYSVS
jgi:hypothetical protein